ncbi:hypothetical protein [Lachnobacterium bovis]|uniref:hypothetical protein n=1 Tax=Lachnobacterium bovis TaxID=140626 RepID=UPI0004832B03|nr:hypothetical protein [Lachnobacterium bovis]
MFNQKRILKLSQKNAKKIEKERIKADIDIIKTRIKDVAKCGQTCIYFSRLSLTEIKWLEKRNFLVTKVTVHGYDVEW